MHNCLSWTVCYNDNCFVYISSKDKLNDDYRSKRYNNNYIIISKLKELVILEKDIESCDSSKTLNT